MNFILNHLMLVCAKLKPGGLASIYSLIFDTYTKEKFEVEIDKFKDEWGINYKLVQVQPDTYALRIHKDER